MPSSRLHAERLEREVHRLLDPRRPGTAEEWKALGPHGLTRLYAIAVMAAESPRGHRLRATALSTLGRLGAGSRIGAFFDALAEPDAPVVVRCGALEGLGYLRMVRAIPLLQAHAFHVDFRVRLYAVGALGRMGNAAAQRVLEDVAGRDPHPQVRRAAQAELAETSAA